MREGLFGRFFFVLRGNKARICGKIRKMRKTPGNSVYKLHSKEDNDAQLPRNLMWSNECLCPPQYGRWKSGEMRKYGQHIWSFLHRINFCAGKNNPHVPRATVRTVSGKDSRASPCGLILEIQGFQESTIFCYQPTNITTVPL